MRKLKNILIIISTLVITPLFVLGQGVERIDITVSPSSPKALQKISLTVISNRLGLNDASITWSKNGVVERQGVGEIKHMTSVGESGKSTIIRVSVTKSNGGFLQKSVDIRPADVYLIWEADSYTPLFYKGKGLASHQSNVRVVAIPDLRNSSGSRFDPDDLIYEWSLDGKINKEQSGVGRDVFNLKGSLISKPKTASLLVKTLGGSVSARKNISVNFVNPEILVYKENPLTGIKNSQSLTEGFVDNNETTFIAEPYFFPEEFFRNNSLEYSWRVDGKNLRNSDKRRSVTFSDDVVGKSDVSVSIKSPYNLLQRASKLFEVIVRNNE